MTMRRFICFYFAVATVAFAAPAQAATTCSKIKDGGIIDSASNPVTLGYDQFGYNYQAHMFNGTFDSVDRTLDGTYWGSTGDVVDDSLIMKWSDDWLSNTDCTGDHRLDRGGALLDGTSRGWLTNQIEGDYIGADSDSHHYTYFAKIVFDAGSACGSGSPSCLWGLYTIIEEVYNDPYGGYHGVNHGMLTKPGLGLYKE